MAEPQTPGAHRAKRHSELLPPFSTAISVNYVGPDRPPLTKRWRDKHINNAQALELMYGCI